MEVKEPTFCPQCGKRIKPQIFPQGWQETKLKLMEVAVTTSPTNWETAYRKMVSIFLVD